MNTGWVKLHRKLNETSFKTRPLVVALFIHLLLNANHKSKKIIWNFEEITIGEGELITGRAALSRATGISPRSIRTALSILLATKTITIKSTNRFSLISILNWDKYQAEATSQTTSETTIKRPAEIEANFKLGTTKRPADHEANSENLTHEPTSSRPTSDQQPTTNKNVNNDKKILTDSVRPCTKLSVSYGNPLISDLVFYLKERLSLPMLDGSTQENRQYCHLLLQKLSRESGQPTEEAANIVKLMIDTAAGDQFWAAKLTSFRSLYRNGIQILKVKRGGSFAYDATKPA